MPNEDKKWWILQQGQTYFAVESAGPPDLNVPAGQRRKVIKAAYNSKAEAQEKGKALAETWHGTWRE